MERKTKTKPFDLSLELPPQGGNVMPVNSLEEEAHALRVMLDRSENMKVAVGQTLFRLLNTKFGGNRNALRDWYEAEVVQGKAHRAWETVRHYLGVVTVHGERAAEVIAERAEWHRTSIRENAQQDRKDAAAFRRGEVNPRNINDLERPERPVKSEYDQRSSWLAQMDYHWFKGQPEWQNKWLRERGLKRL
jgi:hypothetical protein